MSTFEDIPLWERLQSLPRESKDPIFKELCFNFEVGFFLQSQLSPWFESQPWDSSNNNPQLLVQNLVAAIQEKVNQMKENGNDPNIIFARNKLEQIASDIQETYLQDPGTLVKRIADYLTMEIDLINEATRPPPEPMMESTIEMSEPETKPTMNELLEELSASKQVIEAEVRDLEQEKEQYVINFESIIQKHGQLELELQKKKMQLSSSTIVPTNEKQMEIVAIQEEMNKKQAHVRKMAEELLKKRVEVIKNFYEQYKKIEVVQKLLLEQLNSWLEHQKLSCSGWDAPGDINYMQECAGTLAEVTWHSYTYVAKVGNLFEQVLPNNNAEVEKLKEFLKKLFSQLLNKTFIVEKQPPQVLKTQTKFAATVRHLLGGKFSLQVNLPEVVATIVSEKQARDLIKGIKSSDSHNSDDILNSRKTMDFHPDRNVLCAEFKNMSLKRANRQAKKNAETVTAEKSTILFSTKVHFGGESISISVMSLPIAVIVHGNQQPDAEATILWDNAFSVMNREPFAVPDQVPWPKVAEALSMRWRLCNETPLLEEHLQYIAVKALGEGNENDDFSNAVLTRQQFNKDLSLGRPGRNFTFWQWFYGILDLVKRHFINEWKDGLITGFINRHKAEELLYSKDPGTFLLRFSDSEIGGITVAYVDDRHMAQSIQPWTNKHFQMRKLADALHDLEELLFLYPNLDKHDTFGKYYTRQEELSELSQDGYEPTKFAVILGTRKRGTSFGASSPLPDTTPPHPGLMFDFNFGAQNTEPIDNKDNIFQTVMNVEQQSADGSVLNTFPPADEAILFQLQSMLENQSSFLIPDMN